MPMALNWQTQAKHTEGCRFGIELGRRLRLCARLSPFPLPDTRRRTARGAMLFGMALDQRAVGGQSLANLAAASSLAPI